MSVPSCSMCAPEGHGFFLDQISSRIPLFKQMNEFLWIPPSNFPTDSYYDQLKDWWHSPKTEYCRPINEIACKEELTEEDLTTIQETLFYLCEQPEYVHTKLGLQLKEVICRLHDEQLKRILENSRDTVFTRFVESFPKGTANDPLLSEKVDRAVTETLFSYVHIVLELVPKERIELALPKVDNFNPDLDLDILKEKSLPPKETFKETLLNDVKVSLSMLRNFFDNLIHNLLTAFGLFNTQKRGSNVFDSTQIIETYWKVFSAPFVLMWVLGKVIENPWKLYLATFTITGIGLTSLYFYLKFSRKVPLEIPCGKNISWNFKHWELTEAYGRESETQEIVNALNREESVLLSGESGVGKTHLVKSLPGVLPSKQFYVLDGPRLLASQFPSPVDKLEEALDQLKPFKHEVVLIFDEAHGLMDNKHVIDKLKTMVNEDWQIIFATDRSGETFTDPALAGRVHEVIVKALNDENTLRVLDHVFSKEHYERQSRITAYLLEQSQDLQRLRKQPAAALCLLKNTLKKANLLNDPHAGNETKLQLEVEKNELLAGIKPDSLHFNDVREGLNEINQQLEDRRQKINEKARSVLQMHITLFAKQQLFHRCVELAKKDSPQAGQISDFILNHLLPSIFVPGGDTIPIIDEKLVAEVAAEMKQKYKNKGDAGDETEASE